MIHRPVAIREDPLQRIGRSQGVEYSARPRFLGTVDLSWDELLVRTEVLRIHFTLEDLARTRVAETASGWAPRGADAETVFDGGHPHGRACVPPAGAPAAARHCPAPVVESSIRGHVHADRLRRIEAFVDGGCEGMLASFRPLLRWHSPVLESDSPVDRDLYLGGRGLLLVPAFFCCRGTVEFVEAGRRPILFYPVGDGGEKAARDDSAITTRRAVDTLLGRTRSAVLHGIGGGCTTSELARRCGVSVPSASRHAGVLRDAGLLRSRRDGPSVHHSLTRLGAAVIAGEAGAFTALYPSTQ